MTSSPERHPTRAAADLLDTYGPPGLAPAPKVVVPTGFHPLDSVLGGGIRGSELLTLGGRPGVGKTIATLQWARSAALNGFVAVYVSFEHDEDDLLDRLMRLETGEQGTDDADAAGRSRTGAAVDRAVARVRSYADRILFVRSSPDSTDVAELGRILDVNGAGESLLFVDYVQKLAVQGTSDLWSVVAGLKDLALRSQVPVVAVSSTSEAGLVTPRVRLHHLKGAEAIAYESDVVVVMNDKASAVSQAHRAYGSVRSLAFASQTIFSIEKHRRGEAGANLELAKDFRHFRFDPDGTFTPDRLHDHMLGVT